MKKMKIEKLELFKKKIKTIFDNLDDFCESIEQEYEDNPDIEIVSELKKIKTLWEDEEKATKEKAIQYMYESSICFIPTSKVKGKYPISSKFICNLIAIFKGQRDIHHSHVTGKIIGYAHNFRNLRCKENYYTIPVFTHNQFRFDFFLFLKGFRPSVWETTDISIGGKNPTNVNFVIIKNQVKFINTIKYFQQNLASLAASMTNEERENVKKNCRVFLAEKLMYVKDDDVDWILEYLSSGKGTIPLDAETVRVFEKKVLGGYSCINTRMGFDRNLFLNDTKNEKVLFKTTDNELKRF